jgi:hypothetical protein
MNLGILFRSFEKILRENSTTILTAIGASGVISTAYLASRASVKASHTIALEQKRLDLEDKSHPLDKKEKAKLVWKLYIPTVASGSIAVGCIIFSNKLGLKRTAAAYSLLSVSERAFVEYKEKVVEQLGEKKEKSIRDEIAKDRVANSPAVIIGGYGSVLCYEMHTGRYFNSSVEAIRAAVNTINAKINRENEAYLSDFYYIVGLPNTSYSHSTGWTSDRLLELYFSTQMAEDQRPAVTFEYNYVKPL